MATSGFVLSETRNIVVIGTIKSRNEKTGNMIQVWILNRSINPIEAIASGADYNICGNCKHRGKQALINSGAAIDAIMSAPEKRTCYVQVGKAPAGVWKAYQRGKYPKLKDYSIFRGRKVRYGAYGDPAVMPKSVVSKIAKYAAGFTGYTHQWTTNEWLKPFVMASVDTIAELHAARLAGWRTFRVSSNTIAEIGEILCPASDEAGKRTKCIKCTLCNGAKTDDKRKSIFIPIHGATKSAFTILQ